MKMVQEAERDFTHPNSKEVQGAGNGERLHKNHQISLSGQGPTLSKTPGK